jgi:hypothetical protein
MIEHPLDRRPVIVAIAGSNGAGKTSFFHAHLRESGLRFVNADDIARELDMSAYEAAEIADALRHELVRQRESFVFETVFSDPAGEKLAFLRDEAAIQTLPVVLIFDNDDLAAPFRRVAECRNGKPSSVADPVPQWLRALL